jgi:hypothetical protein
MSRTLMNETPKQPAARPIFRWLAAITIPVFVVMAVVSAFGIPDANGKPDFVSAVLFAWGAIFFGSIAATGQFKTGGNQRIQLVIAAKKYADDEITLEEYGSRTKHIVKGE